MEDILSWQTGVFALAIFIFSFLVRRAAELVFPTLRQDTPLSTAQRIWDELLLPSIPVLTGMALAASVKSWQYPPAISSLASRVIFGAVCGFFSSYAYRVLKALMTQKFSVDLPDLVNVPQAQAVKPPALPGGKAEG